MPNFRCAQVSKKFDGIQALNEVTLGFEEGITAVIGPNGAGKTTLINVMTGFIRPDRGACYLGDLEITSLSPFRIARLGVARTFQDQRLAYQLSAMENVALACSHPRSDSLITTFVPFLSDHRRLQESALHALQVVGLDHASSVIAGELSHGQRKLLSLACAIAMDPKTLILDEPVSGIDLPSRDLLVPLMKKLAADGILVVFIEHDMTAVRQLAERVILMNEGQIIAEGPTGEILDRKEIIQAYLT